MTLCHLVQIKKHLFQYLIYSNYKDYGNLFYKMKRHLK